MQKLLKKNLFSGLAALLLFTVLAPALVVFAPPAKTFADVSPDAGLMCVPPLLELNDDYSVEGVNDSDTQGDLKGELFKPDGAWLKVKVIDRSTLQLIFDDSGKHCDNPDDVLLKHISRNDTVGSFGQLVNGYLYDVKLDDDWDYRRPAGDSSAEDTKADEIFPNVKDAFGNNSRIITTAEIQEALKKTELYFGFEESTLPFLNCKGGDNDDDGWNFILRRVEKQMQWTCEDHIDGDWTGISIGSVFEDLDNFNTTYRVQGTGTSTQIVHVADDQADDFTFSWCLTTGVGEFRNNDCAGEYTLTGATPEQLDAQSASNAIKLTMRKTGSQDTAEVQVAGSQTGSAAASVDPGTTIGTAGGDSNPTCETQGFNLSWIFCPLINGALDGSDWLFNKFIVPFLQTSPITTDSEDPVFQIWASFRTIGNILLVFGLLFIVFAQSIGGGLVDAYTAKKVLPRILIAAILINISIYLVALLVDIFNVLGAGVGQLITAPLKNSGSFNFTVFDGGGAANRFIGAAGLFAAFFGIYKVGAAGGSFVKRIFNFDNVIGTNFAATGAPASSTAGNSGGGIIQFVLLFVVLPIFLAILGIFVTLIIRRGLILFLAVIAPVALVLYAVPATEKYAKKWLDLFVKTLLVYPIIIAFMAIGDVLSTLIFKANSDSIIGEMVGIVVLFIPMFLIPFAFKFAGGAAATVYGALSGASKKGREALLGNPNDQHSLRNRTRRKLGESLSWKQASYTDAGRKVGASRSARTKGWLADRIGNVDARLARYNALNKEEAEQMSSTGRDALRYAANGYEILPGQARSDGTINNTGKKEYWDSKGKLISYNTYSRGKSLYGATPSAIAQNTEYTLRKAQNDTDVKNMRFAFAKNALAAGWTDQEILDGWSAATYPHKGGLMASEWYSTPVTETSATGQRSIKFKDITNDVQDMTKTDAQGRVTQEKSSYSKFIGDLHKTRLAYQLPARDQDFRAMLDRQTQLEDKILAGQTLDQYEADQLAMTYEVFDAASQSYATGGIDPATAGSPTAGVDRATAGSAAAQPVIQQAIKQRRERGLSLRTDSTNTATAANTRQIIRQTGAPLPPGTAGPTPPPTLIAEAIVTGDLERTEIPKSVS